METTNSARKTLAELNAIGREWTWSNCYKLRTEYAIGAHAGRSARTGTKLHLVRVDRVIEVLETPSPLKVGDIFNATTICYLKINNFALAGRGLDTKDITCKKC